MATDSTGAFAGISGRQREDFAALLDEMIPAVGGMPSATGAAADSTGLDAVLRARPDLLEPLRAALDELAAALAPASADRAEPAEPQSALAIMRSPGHEQAWGVLGLVAATAYFLNPDVRATLGYPGQQAIPVDEQPDDIDPELLAAVSGRPPVYRPTPAD